MVTKPSKGTEAPVAPAAGAKHRFLRVPRQLFNEKEGGERLPPFLPLSVASSFFSTVIENRKRSPVTEGGSLPWCSIALLGYFQPDDLRRRVLTGTGFLIHERIVLTAGHNFDDAGRYAGPGVFFGLNSGGPPRGMLEFIDYRVNKALDLAVALLEEPQDRPLQLFQGALTSDSKVRVVGYGYDDPSGGARMTTDEGDVDSVAGNTLKYLINTHNGDSGAPILVRLGDAEWAVAGVHLRGDAGRYNGGVRLTPNVVQAVNALIKELQDAHE